MAGITSEYNQHHIITDWQYRQAVEWDFETSYYYRYYSRFHDLNHFGYEEYYYLGLNDLFSIKSKWFIL